VETGEMVHTFPLGALVYSAVFSGDGRHVLTASYDRTAKLWSVETGEVVHTFRHGAPVFSAVFSAE